jgi:hypothetical protein
MRKDNAQCKCERANAKCVNAKEQMQKSKCKRANAKEQMQNAQMRNAKKQLARVISKGNNQR